MSWWRSKAGEAAGGLAVPWAMAACRGASSMVMVGFAALYFAALSLGSMAWIALAFAPAITSSTGLRLLPWVSTPLSWSCAVATLAWAAWVARRIHVLARPRMRRTMPGGSWAAWSVVAWLAWMDAALELGRAAPDGYGSTPGPVKRRSSIGVEMALGLAHLPTRSMACALALVMMLGMPIAMHAAMALAMPLAIVDLLMPNGPSMGLLDRVKRVALDLSKEGTEEWAQGERAQIDKEVEKVLGEAKKRRPAPESKDDSERKSRRL